MLKLTVYNYWRDANNYQQEKTQLFYKIIHFSMQSSAVVNRFIVKTYLNSAFTNDVKRKKNRKMFKVSDLVPLTESTDFIFNSVCNFTSFRKESHIGSTFLVFPQYYIYLQFQSRVEYWLQVSIDCQFCCKGKTLVRLPQFPVIITSSYTVRPFLQFHLFIYSISSVFVVLCLILSGVSMMYFQNWFLSQVNGNFIRESIIL